MSRAGKRTKTDEPTSGFDVFEIQKRDGKETAHRSFCKIRTSRPSCPVWRRFLSTAERWNSVSILKNYEKKKINFKILLKFASRRPPELLLSKMIFKTSPLHQKFNSPLKISMEFSRLFSSPFYPSFFSNAVHRGGV